MAARRNIMITWAGVLGIFAAIALIVLLYFWFQTDTVEWGTRSIAVADIPDAPEQINAGAAIYINRCAGCHGESLQEHEIPKPAGTPWHEPNPLMALIAEMGARPPAAPMNLPRSGPVIQPMTEDEMLSLLGFLRSRWPEPRQQG